MTNVATFHVTTPTDRQIVMTRVFDAPPAVVFEAWTRREHVTHWWDPSGAPLAICEIDLRPGGAFRWVNRTGAGEQVFAGTYREIVAPGRLVFAVRVFPSRPDPLATLLFREHGKQTKLTMTIECESMADRDAMLAMRIDVGTGHTLDNLDAYLLHADIAGRS